MMNTSTTKIFGAHKKEFYNVQKLDFALGKMGKHSEKVLKILRKDRPASKHVLKTYHSQKHKNKQQASTTSTKAYQIN